MAASVPYFCIVSQGPSVNFDNEIEITKPSQDHPFLPIFKLMVECQCFGFLGMELVQHQEEQIKEGIYLYYLSMMLPNSE